MAVAEPKKFKSENWDKFCSDALRYHESTRPNENLVIHKIETFRKYMSKEAIERLSGYMLLHPRFETVEGWDQWLSGATEMLSYRDMALYRVSRVSRPVKAKNSEDIVAKYAKGKVSLRGFWRGLDKLVEDNALSGDEQRELFWLNLKEEHREWLITRCALFDPENVVWEKQDAVVAKIAEQEMSRFAESLVVDDLLRNRPMYTFAMLGLTIFSQMLNLISFIIMGFDVRIVSFIAFLLVVHVVAFAMAIRKDRRSVRKLEAKRRVLFDPINA